MYILEKKQENARLRKYYKNFIIIKLIVDTKKYVHTQTRKYKYTETLKYNGKRDAVVIRRR